MKVSILGNLFKNNVQLSRFDSYAAFNLAI